MPPKTARYILIFLVIAAIPCTLYPLWVTFFLYQAITNGVQSITFDTADYFFLIASVFFSYGYYRAV